MDVSTLQKITSWFNFLRDISCPPYQRNAASCYMLLRTLMAHFWEVRHYRSSPAFFFRINWIISQDSINSHAKRKITMPKKILKPLLRYKIQFLIYISYKSFFILVICASKIWNHLWVNYIDKFYYQFFSCQRKSFFASIVSPVAPPHSTGESKRQQDEHNCYRWIKFTSIKVDTVDVERENELYRKSPTNCREECEYVEKISVGFFW